MAIELQPGEMSLHHVRLVHGSPPNPSNDRRIGFAIRYIPTSVRQIAGEDSATLVRGVDRYHHFELEPRPTRDMDPEIRRAAQADRRAQRADPLSRHRSEELQRSARGGPALTRAGWQRGDERFDSNKHLR